MKREMRVVYAPGDNKQKSMIRIVNRFLIQYGFDVGNRIQVEYGKGVITITTKN
jgi:hypothetical protein